MERSQFTFYRSFWDALKVLPEEEKLPFVMAICAYAFGDEDCPEAKIGQSQASFLLVKPNLDASSRKAASGKKGGSKPKAKRKQTESKPEAREGKQEESKKEESKTEAIEGEQTESYIEGEKEKEKEREIEGDTPLYPPDAASGEDYGFGPELSAAFAEWLQYKRERREAYKPTGLRSLVTETRHAVEAYGEEAVAALIRQCMAANWKGVIFDRLKNTAQTQSGVQRENENVFMRMLREEEQKRGQN